MNYRIRFLSANNTPILTMYRIFILLFLSSFTLFAQTIPEPMSPPRLVNDFANVLSEKERDQLETKLRLYNDSTSSEVTVVTLNTINNDDVTRFAIDLGEKWGVGKEGRDNGVVVLVVVEDRLAAITTGYGMEGAITDASTYTIRERYMNPNFRNGDFYKGLDEATTAIFKLASGEWTSDNLKRTGNSSSPLPFLIVFFIMFIGIPILITIVGVRKYKKQHFGGHTDLGWLAILALMNKENASKRSNRSGGFGGFSGGSGSFGGGSSFGGFGGGSFGGGGSGGSW
ncbi:TPM domain-containing protein [Fulvivirgaceae bacterium LMO-SS25]